MTLKKRSKKPIGVVGAGSFGTAIANLLSESNPVILYARNSELVDMMKTERKSLKFALNPNIEPTNDLEFLADSCDVIFPIVSSTGFRDLMINFAPFLHPYHILIHGTKGLDIKQDSDTKKEKFDPGDIMTMSQVITSESVIVRVGCLAGPNLATELVANQPAATVVASHFEEVIQVGKRLLRNDRFRVYGNNDLIGIELAGVLKNIIAIASGTLSGLGLGENARALLISRGLVEMIYLGKALGGNVPAFIGLAGIGDLVATCSSKLSRNYTVGFRLAKGESFDHINATMDEVAEGINTVKIIKKLAEHYNVQAPITSTVYQILFENLKPETGVRYLMRFPLDIDIDFL